MAGSDTLRYQATSFGVTRNNKGIRDITAVQLCETENFECKLLDRSHGAVWSSTCGIDGIDS
ncbi:hypothetical protein AAHE18_02G040800 [Arachis hypogaea]|uniref:Uncharacterized protein n=1 Tax=Arachis hypogaea TaxID=3818 RepID=A0A445EHB8_ARAHY|nr:hypothetical protein Ahy_A02g009464 [Arachis hypogaea]